MKFLIDYFKITSVINMGMLFEMLATEIVESPANADVVVSDEELDGCENAEVIRSCDFEKVMALLSR